MKAPALSHDAADPAFGDIERRVPAAGYGAPFRHTPSRLATDQFDTDSGTVRELSPVAASRHGGGGGRRAG